jgi:hypothetical protein
MYWRLFWDQNLLLHGVAYGSRDIVKNEVIWRIRNGDKVRIIWGEKWIPSPSTFMIQSPPHGLAADAMVSELVDK